ncbi:rod shape-determining protein MreD [Pseudacidovorax intermedius]|uniref:Rod shape-determining protein MreD n=1 Tax=Pseudacidovorax intermedius TaxID=433924 RepID=A0A370FQX9_9BURK|nr:rod shape-determining protein MreD [Pseudacidovorax intermedius]RDI29294.1 rod shape-determining protein MreD [Pseudacidovorax intermedius]
MIMRPGQEQLLLPVRPLFIWGSLFVALLLNMLPLGRLPWMPDLLAVVLVFWGVHQPARIGLGAAFVFGLAMDVHESSLLGQHALSYATLSFFAIIIHRRLLWYRLSAQALQLVPLFALSRLIELGVRLIGGGIFPGWITLLGAAIEAMLWPVVTWLLLIPQRRPPEQDENRPL